MSFGAWGLTLSMGLLLASTVVSLAEDKPVQPEVIKQEHKGLYPWLPLAADGIHDPTNAVLKELSEPGEVHSMLPFDAAGGNYVRWAEAIEQGYITPRSTFQSYDPNAINYLDLDIIRPNTSIMPRVRFPHKKHTVWLDCANCHEQLFKSRAGATKINMWLILNGEKCGLCHGAVAFPPTECLRCHSYKRPASDYMRDDPTDRDDRTEQ